MNHQPVLLFALCLLFQLSEARGQNSQVRAEHTILKINKSVNPYSIKQTEWLIKNGFNVQDYSWDNKDINRQLDECLKRQSGAVLFAILAGTGGLLAISTESSGFLVPSVAAALISIGKTNKSKSQIRQIEKWRAVPVLKRFDTVNLVEDTKTEFSLRSPYKASQNKFLIQNGFDLHTYTWDNEAVNLNLEKAIESRKNGHIMLGVAAFSFVTGGIFKMVSAVVENDEDRNDASATGNTFFIVSGGMLLTSLILNSSAKNKVRKAMATRKKPLRTKTRLQKNDLH